MRGLYSQANKGSDMDKLQVIILWTKNSPENIPGIFLTTHDIASLTAREGKYFSNVFFFPLFFTFLFVCFLV